MDSKFFGCVGVTLAFVALLIMSAIVNGFIVSVLWAWFVVPVFGLPVLTIPQAIGISIIVSYLTKEFYNTNDSKKDVDSIIFESLFKIIVTPVFVLGIAYIVTLFM